MGGAGSSDDHALNPRGHAYRTCRRADGSFSEMLLNIATNAEDHRGSEAAFHLKEATSTTKGRMTWLVVLVERRSSSPKCTYHLLKRYTQDKRAVSNDSGETYITVK